MSSDINLHDANMNAAQGTYTGFIRLLKRGTIASVIVTVFVVLVIAS